MDKDNKSFQYYAEQAKLDFQQSLSSLLEIQSHLKEKKDKAKNADSIFFTTNEIEVIDNWITQTSTQLMGSYDIIHKTNRMLYLKTIV